MVVPSVAASWCTANPMPLSWTRPSLNVKSPLYWRMASANPVTLTPLSEVVLRLMMPCVEVVPFPVMTVLVRLRPSAASATSTPAPASAAMRKPSMVGVPEATMKPPTTDSAPRGSLASMPAFAPVSVTSPEIVTGAPSNWPASTSMVLPSTAASKALWTDMPGNTTMCWLIMS